jgi:hypothetical protein
LRTKLRMALEINSRDGIDELGLGVWRLGEARRGPVLLARSLLLLWREPALFDRVRVAGASIRVIAPRPAQTRGAPFGPGVEWLPLGERFTFYGGGVTYIPADESRAVSEPDAPAYGPFSEDFRRVDLADWPRGAIRCTEGQAAVFRALWSFAGEPMPAERIMQRANLESEKPIDVFKIKARDKGKPEAEGPLFAYRSLVIAQKRAGLYSMPCAANRSR